MVTSRLEYIRRLDPTREHACYKLYDLHLVAKKKKTTQKRTGATYKVQVNTFNKICFFCHFFN